MEIPFLILVAAIGVLIYSVLSSLRNRGDVLQSNHPASRAQNKVSISLKWNTDYNDFSNNSLESKSSSIADCLASLAKQSRLYAIFQVSSDSEQSAILTHLKETGLIDAGLKLHRIMFCDTQQGRMSMVRQLQPFIHIDDDLELVGLLRGKVPNILHISPSLEDTIFSVLQAIQTS